MRVKVERRRPPARVHPKDELVVSEQPRERLHVAQTGKDDVALKEALAFSRAVQLFAVQLTSLNAPSQSTAHFVHDFVPRYMR